MLVTSWMNETQAKRAAAEARLRTGLDWLHPRLQVTCAKLQLGDPVAARPAHAGSAVRPAQPRLDFGLDLLVGCGRVLAPHALPEDLHSESRQVQDLLELRGVVRRLHSPILEPTPR